jgi:hypothetical protein
MPTLEIWLTSLMNEPAVHVNEDLIRVYLHLADDLDHVLATHGTQIPAPLDSHLRLLWAGECPTRSFEVVDESTVIIRLNGVES